MKYLTGKEGRRDCTLLYYCVQSSDYLRCVDILNHKITPLIRLLIIQNYPMKKQTLSQEFRQNNIKSLRKLVNHHSPICINIHLIYLFSLEGKSSRLSSILLFSVLLDKKSRFTWFCSILSTKEQLVQTTEDKFLHLCELFRFALLCQVVSSAYSVSIVAYNLL